MDRGITSTTRDTTAFGHGATVVWILASLFTAGLTLSCYPTIASTDPGSVAPSRLAELWVEPADRDLRHGVGGARLAPDPDTPYTVIAIKRRGFSSGYTVTDEAGSEWSAKFPPEAAAEVVASRLMWGVGYHQPPVYYLANWTAVKATSPNPQMPARFREKNPDLNGLRSNATWSFYRNPFVGTTELAGLLVLQVMLGNSDLKDENNALYELGAPLEGARRWYVTRDLGHTFGRTGILEAPRNDIDVFEQTPFITGVAGGRVRFDYRGRHRVLLDGITPADVRWICGRLDRLTDAQWRDAFRAGGYPDATAGRFIRRLKQKIAEGLALQG